MLTYFMKEIFLFVFQSGAKNPEDIDFKETTQDLEDSYEAALKSFKESITELGETIRKVC